jgi:hypothetical protein
MTPSDPTEPRAGTHERVTTAAMRRAPARSGRRRRRWPFVVALAVLAGSAVPAYFGVRGAFFPAAFGVEPIQATPSFQEPALLARAWSLPVAKTFATQLAYQRNGSTCGPTSLGDTERSFGLASDERSILDGTGKCWSGMCFGGLSLDEVAAVAKRNTKHRVTVLRGLSYDQFRALLPTFNDPSRRYIANFQRAALMGVGAGHFSPIGGYLQDEDLVFVLDVNEKWKPWLVSPQRLFAAVDTLSNDGKRGLLLLE